LFAGVEISEGVGHIVKLPTHMVIRKSEMYYKYTGCPRRNGQNFGRVFLML